PAARRRQLGWPPPGPAPVPSTTLFRSEAPVALPRLVLGEGGHDRLAADGDDGGPLRGLGRSRRCGGRSHAHIQPQHATNVNPQQDRKSTRLNASHVKTTYAGFCSTAKN